MAVNMGAFGIRPEAHYEYIQARHPHGRMSTHGITVPLNLLLQTSLSEINGFAVFAGPYYSYRFSGKQGNSSLDFENIYCRNEAGLNFGAELRILSIRLGVVRRQALTDFTRAKNDDGAHIRNRSVFVSLSYDF
jgi:hypothetical protein